jgi:hypothetical protein
MVVFSLQLTAGRPMRVLPRNPKRAAYTVVNFSGYDVYLGHDQNVSDSGPTMGIRIINGSSYEDEFHKGEVWLYCVSSAVVTIEESLKEE